MWDDDDGPDGWGALQGCLIMAALVLVVLLVGDIAVHAFLPD